MPHELHSTWNTADLGLAAFLVARGFPTTINASTDSGSLSTFGFDASDNLDAVVLSWGREGTVEGGRYWAELCNLKASIRDIRRSGHSR